MWFIYVILVHDNYLLHFSTSLWFWLSCDSKSLTSSSPCTENHNKTNVCLFYAYIKLLFVQHFRGQLERENIDKAGSSSIINLWIWTYMILCPISRPILNAYKNNVNQKYLWTVHSYLLQFSSHLFFFFSSIVKVIHLMGIIHFQLSFSLYSIMFTKTYFIQLKEHFMTKRRDIHIYTDTQMYSFISTNRKWNNFFIVGT